MVRDTLLLCYTAVFLCIITPYVCPSYPFLPLLPITFALSKGIHGERTIDGIICGLVYALYFALLCHPLTILIHVLPYHWVLLSSYSLFFMIYNRDILGIDTEKLAHNLWFRMYLDIFFNPPLLFAWHIVAYFGGQLSAPLVTIIDDNICVGSLPCFSHSVLKLYGAPYHIRAVINLCDEVQGPIKEYEKFNIDYIQINTLDTTPPSIGNITLGIKFIDRFLKRRDKEHNGLGRVFIHCKGGRGRSVAMAVCWLLSQGMNINDAIALIKSKRKVTSREVIHYHTVQHFVHRSQQK